MMLAGPNLHRASIGAPAVSLVRTWHDSPAGTFQKKTDNPVTRTEAAVELRGKLRAKSLRRAHMNGASD
jgi:hypothetical protein